MAFRLIALDVDGTLLDPDGQIRPRVRQAIRAAVAGGAIVTLATGRRHRAAREIADDLGLATPLILYNGSLVYDTLTERAKFHRVLPASFVAEAVTLMREAGLSPGVFQSPVSGENIFLGPAQYDSPYLRDYATHPSRAFLVQRRPFEELHSVANPLVVFATGSARIARGVVAQLTAGQRLACQVFPYSLRNSQLDDLYGFDVLPPGHSKALALTWLAAHHGLTLAETLVVGDGPNDIELIKVAGLGVAMGQATSEVQAAANVVVASNAEDGVAEAIERFVLS